MRDNDSVAGGCFFGIPNFRVLLRGLSPCSFGSSVFQHAFEVGAIAIPQHSGYEALIDPQEIALGLSAYTVMRLVFRDPYGGVINFSMALAEMLDDSGGVRDEYLVGNLTVRMNLPDNLVD